jgi:hypothetical protein
MSRSGIGNRESMCWFLRDAGERQRVIDTIPHIFNVQHATSCRAVRQAWACPSYAEPWRAMLPSFKDFLWSSGFLRRHFARASPS